MNNSDKITLRRECEAIEIPYGSKTTLPAGTQVTITQSLGGTYTVITDRGYMVRIAGKDADALGSEPSACSEEAVAAVDEPLEKMVWDQLRTVYDPEIPVNVVDLGLVYECHITALPSEGNAVDVVMTLTAPGCGMGDVLKMDAQARISSLPGVKRANVEIVFDPPWNQSMMSEAAKLELGLL